ncbi:MAG: hypothetical protein AAF228_04460 [Pseudomonadota bacterium]
MKAFAIIVLSLFTFATTTFAQEPKKGSSSGTEQPATAADEEKPIEVTEADIAEAIKIIEAVKPDETKQKLYCDMISLGIKADEALDKKDEKKADEFGKQIEEKAIALGDEFGKAMEIVAQLDPEDKKGEALFKSVDDLDAKCDIPPAE